MFSPSDTWPASPSTSPPPSLFPPLSPLPELSCDTPPLPPVAVHVLVPPPLPSPASSSTTKKRPRSSEPKETRLKKHRAIDTARRVREAAIMLKLQQLTGQETGKEGVDKKHKLDVLEGVAVFIEQLQEEVRGDKEEVKGEMDEDEARCWSKAEAAVEKNRFEREVEVWKAELAVEKVKCAEAVQRVAELTEQMEQVRSQLAFYNSSPSCAARRLAIDVTDDHSRSPSPSPPSSPHLILPSSPRVKQERDDPSTPAVRRYDDGGWVEVKREEHREAEQKVSPGSGTLTLCTDLSLHRPRRERAVARLPPPAFDGQPLVLLARCSTDNDGNAEFQLFNLHQLARQSVGKLGEKWRVVGEYMDYGVSTGKSALKSMMQCKRDLEKGVYGDGVTVLVMDLSRFSHLSREKALEVHGHVCEEWCSGVELLNAIILSTRGYRLLSLLDRHPLTEVMGIDSSEGGVVRREMRRLLQQAEKRSVRDGDRAFNLKQWKKEMLDREEVRLSLRLKVWGWMGICVCTVCSLSKRQVRPKDCPLLTPAPLPFRYPSKEPPPLPPSFTDSTSSVSSPSSPSSPSSLSDLSATSLSEVPPPASLSDLSATSLSEVPPPALSAEERQAEREAARKVARRQVDARRRARQAVVLLRLRSLTDRAVNWLEGVQPESENLDKAMVLENAASRFEAVLDWAAEWRSREQDRKENQARALLAIVEEMRAP